MIKFEAFTSKYNGRANQIVTKCRISQGFKPESKGNHTFVDFDSLWDTGATNTVISPKVVSDLGLKPVSKVPMAHADGSAMVDVYIINIILPNSVGFPMVAVLCSNLTGTDVLIGMDIISQGDFSITNLKGKTTFSFRHPSIQEIDYVQEHRDANNVKQPTEKVPAVSLNAPCPCGSGKKYKRCHGADAKKVA